MTWLLPILRHRATWGVGIVVGMLVAIAAHGRLQYHAGYQSGFVARAVDARADAAAAKATSDSAWRVLFAQSVADRERTRAAEQAAARARARSAAAEARLDIALARVQGDTLPPTPACGELATACQLARDTWAAERDSMQQVLDEKDSTIVRRDRTIFGEPQRTADAVHAALVQQRTTFVAPARLPWAVGGFGAGALTSLLLGLR